MSQFIVGVTGGIGSGKSEVMRRFQARGIEAFDADDMARVVVEPGRPALDRIRHKLGSNILTEAGELNRSALRRLVFSNPDIKTWLEQLLHPLINAELKERLAKARSPYALLVSPLLFESGQDRLVDRVLVIDVPRAVQLRRAAQRDGVATAQIEAIIDSQMDRKKRLAKAQDIIDNTRSKKALAEQVAQLHQRYLSLSRLHS